MSVLAYLLTGVLGTLGSVFCASAWSKVRSPAARRRFAASLRDLGLLPGRFAGPAAVAVPAAEVAVAAGCLLSLTGARVALPTLLAAAALLAVLTAGVAVEVRNGTGARCACFGTAARPLGPRHLVRNGLLLALAAAGIVAAAAGPAGAEGLPALGAGVLAGVLVARLDDLLDLFTPAASPRS